MTSNPGVGMSAATPATIWWCIAHKTTGDYLACVAPWHPLFDPDVDGDCEMVQRRLVNDSALVVERDATGQWPEWAIRVISNPTGPYVSEVFAEVILDALAARREAST